MGCESDKKGYEKTPISDLEDQKGGNKSESKPSPWSDLGPDMIKMIIVDGVLVTLNRKKVFVSKSITVIEH